MHSVDLLSLPDQEAVVVVPFARHRRDQAKPGCLRGVLAVGGVLVRLAWAGVRRVVARLCRRITVVRTSCGSCAVVAV